ncbi:pollen Ole e 1 allergen and extensin family protein [Striga asiatica]|uniref:Pollen Ole e 1 allergen and extensin family protein n=1 Tax=Striga asiatica TaxID=4170 RepID=A0A5A7P6E1_STRAF|nr:pollen Ole e 1 allergen and extensin family protein [Striga asiatica]
MVPFSNILLLTTLVSIALSGITLSALQYDVTLSGVATCPNSSLSVAHTYSVISRAQVEVVCPNSYIGNVLLKNTTTDNEGVYSFTFSVVEIHTNKLQLCYINVSLPMDGSCTFVPPGGAILYPILAVETLLRTVLVYSPGAPTYA